MAFNLQHNTVPMVSSLINSTTFAIGPTMSSVTIIMMMIMVRVIINIVRMGFMPMTIVLVSIIAQMELNSRCNSVPMVSYSMVKCVIGHKMSHVMLLLTCE